MPHQITARYSVIFRIVADGFDFTREYYDVAALTQDYTAFEDIRKIVANRRGCEPESILIVSLNLLLV